MMLKIYWILTDNIQLQSLTADLKQNISGDKIIAPGVFGLGSILFSVNMDYTESDLSSISIDDLRNTYKKLNFIYLNSEKEIDKRIISGMYGKHYWKLFLWLALLMLIAEMFLANQWDKIFKGKLWK